MTGKEAKDLLVTARYGEDWQQIGPGKLVNPELAAWKIVWDNVCWSNYGIDANPINAALATDVVRLCMTLKFSALVELTTKIEPPEPPSGQMTKPKPFTRIFS